MGRKRSYRNRHLPPNLHQKHGAWYLVRSIEGRQQWQRLSTDYATALSLYAKHTCSSRADRFVDSKKARSMNQKKLKRMLSYDPETGLFTWRNSARSCFGGKVAGVHRPDGYIQVRVDWRLYYAHRLAWLYMNGEFPKGHVDHINGVRSDNSASNLRVAGSQRQNAQNQKLRADNKSGHMGVSWRKDCGKWRARIKHRGGEVFLGHFDDAREAGQAYAKAKAKLHTFNPTIRNV